MSSVRLSVCRSVCNVGGSSWKLIARTISPSSSLSVAQRPSTYSRGIWGNLGETSGWVTGVGKSGVLEHTSGNISETRKVRGKVTMEGLGYRSSPTHFRTVPTVPSPTPTANSSLRLRVRSQPYTKLQSLLSQERVYTNFQFCTHIHRIDRNKCPLKNLGKIPVGVLKDS